MTQSPPNDTPTSAPVWRVIPDLDRYEVSENGQIRHRSTQRILALHPNEHGYLVASIHRNGRTVNRLVHRLVAVAFLGPCPNGKQVNHRDGLKQSNHWTNLEYVTLQENLAHARANGLDIRGERNGHARLTTEQVRAIRAAAVPGARNHRQIAAQYGVSRSLISMIAERKVWTHV